MCFHLIIHNLTRASFAAYAVCSNKFLYIFTSVHLCLRLHTLPYCIYHHVRICPEMKFLMEFYLLLAFCVNSAKIMKLLMEQCTDEHIFKRYDALQ